MPPAVLPEPNSKLIDLFCMNYQYIIVPDISLAKNQNCKRGFQILKLQTEPQVRRRIHDSWSSRASSIMANGITEPNYMSRSEMLTKISSGIPGQTRQARTNQL